MSFNSYPEYKRESIKDSRIWESFLYFDGYKKGKEMSIAKVPHRDLKRYTSSKNLTKGVLAMKYDTTLKLNVSKAVKDEASEIYERLGISLNDAVRIFLAKTIEEKGLPFDLKLKEQSFDYDRMNVVTVDENHPLPESLDCEEDSYYDRYDTRS